jgi:hypothetical protein
MPVNITKKILPKTDTHQKALSINLDPKRYGTIAEIGAGQEVSNWLFKVGAASGTVAKTISAYDMTFSDEIYGKCNRYVSKERLEQMLDHEWDLLIQRLEGKTSSEKTYFVLANTVSARNYSGTNISHGWMGIRYQSKPKAEPNEIIIHFNLLDNTNQLQQGAVGVLGINLLFHAFDSKKNNEYFISGLTDNLGRERIEIEYINVSGPDFQLHNNNLLGLELLRLGLADVIMYDPEGKLCSPAETLYKKPIVIERGSFKRDLAFHNELLNISLEKLKSKLSETEREPLALFEITTSNLLTKKPPTIHQLMQRVESLTAEKKHVMISDYSEYYHLTRYLNRFSKSPIRFAMGVASLVHIFQEKFYTELQGGILEALGRLLASNVKMYVFPMQQKDLLNYLTASLLDLSIWELPLKGEVNLHNIKPLSSIEHLYNYLLDQKALIEITLDEK